jgi:hypothetical protein
MSLSTLAAVSSGASFFASLSIELGDLLLELGDLRVFTLVPVEEARAAVVAELAEDLVRHLLDVEPGALQHVVLEDFLEVFSANRNGLRRICGVVAPMPTFTLTTAART